MVKAYVNVGSMNEAVEVEVVSTHLDSRPPFVVVRAINGKPFPVPPTCARAGDVLRFDIYWTDEIKVHPSRISIKREDE